MICLIAFFICGLHQAASHRNRRPGLALGLGVRFAGLAPGVPRLAVTLINALGGGGNLPLLDQRCPLRDCRRQ
jgi:hypothetical protein